jgi:hypothetical protein
MKGSEAEGETGRGTEWRCVHSIAGEGEAEAEDDEEAVQEAREKARQVHGQEAGRAVGVLRTPHGPLGERAGAGSYTPPIYKYRIYALNHIFLMNLYIFEGLVRPHIKRLPGINPRASPMIDTTLLNQIKSTTKKWMIVNRGGRQRMRVASHQSICTLNQRQISLSDQRIKTALSLSVDINYKL